MLEQKTLQKHDRYVEELCALIANRYDRVEHHALLYSKRRRLIAEIDVIACKGSCCDIYEVKCSPRFTKARRQLIRIRKLLAHKVRNTFLFCGESRTIYAIKDKRHKSGQKRRMQEEELRLPPLRHPPWKKNRHHDGPSVEHRPRPAARLREANKKEMNWT